MAGEEEGSGDDDEDESEEEEEDTMQLDLTNGPVRLAGAYTRPHVIQLEPPPPFATPSYPPHPPPPSSSPSHPPPTFHLDNVHR